jgi:hypothetical protein
LRGWGGEERGGVGGKGGGGGKGKKWPKPCMHIWVIKLKKKRNDFGKNYDSLVWSAPIDWVEFHATEWREIRNFRECIFSLGVALGRLQDTAIYICAISILHILHLVIP